METIKIILIEWSFPIVMMITNIVIAVGAILAGLSAWGALEGWKKEMSGRTEYELALNLLVELHKYHRAVKKCLSDFEWLDSALKSIAADGNLEVQENLNKTFLDRYKRFLANIATQEEVLYKYLLTGDKIWSEKLLDLSEQLFNTVHRLEYPIARVMIEENLPYPYDWILTEPENDLDETIDNQESLNSKIQKYMKDIESILKPKLEP